MRSRDATPEHEDQEVFDEALCRACSGIGVNVNSVQRSLMFEHYREVVEANRRFNLTRITSPADAAAKHYADSLALLGFSWIEADREVTVLDVGTGAGFPAVPLAIMRDNWRITAIDGTGKKARFLTEAAKALGLVNLEARHARAEALSREGERFDLVLLRAVASIARGLDETHRLIGPGGAVVFYKTSNITRAELGEGAKAARRFRLGEPMIFDATLQAPDGPMRRQLIGYRRRLI